MEFDLDSAVIHYTVNGGYPTDKAPVYSKPIVVQESAVVRAKSRHPDFATSTLAERRLIKVAHLPDSMSLQTAPDSLYPGRGKASLFDLQKGSRDLKDGRWLGFRGDTVLVEGRFKKPISCKTMLVSTLSDPGAWVYPPARIEVYGDSGDGHWLPMGVWTSPPASRLKDRPADYTLYERVVLRPVELERFRIRIIPFGNLPEGHPGAGQAAWLFLDEIIFQ